jgi:hypothetical protein
MAFLGSNWSNVFAMSIDSPGILNPQVLLILFGGGLLVVAVIGGGLKVKQIEIPAVSRLNRFIAGVLGLSLLGAGLFLVLYTPERLHMGTKEAIPHHIPEDVNELKPIACSELANLRSGEGAGSTNVVFRNQKSSLVNLFWVNHQGQPKLWTMIAPGKTVAAPTHPTHVWLVMNDQNQCLVVFRAGPQNAVALIR